MQRQERELLEELRKGLEQIATIDKEDGRGDPAFAYAHALGRANGIAKSLLIVVECRLGVQ